MEPPFLSSRKIDREQKLPHALIQDFSPNERLSSPEF
jgi:hypothetical protein